VWSVKALDFLILIFAHCIRRLCGHGINTGIFIAGRLEPADEASPATPLEKYKGNSLHQYTRASTPRPRFGTVLFLPRPRPPAHAPLSSLVLAVPTLALAVPILALRLFAIL
jgi:hypothetical protein